MGKCRFCGKSVGILRGAHKDCKSRHEQGKRRITGLVCAAISRDPNTLMSEIFAIAKDRHIYGDELQRQKFADWEGAIIIANSSADFNEHTHCRLLLLASTLSISESDYCTNRIWKRYLTSLPYDHELEAKKIKLKLAAKKTVQESRKALAEAERIRERKRQETERLRKSQEQREAECQSRLQEQEAERQRKLREEQAKLQHIIQEEAERQRNLQEDEAERQRKLQEQEAEGQRKLREAQAKLQHEMQEEDERQRNLQEDEAERQRKLQEDEAERQRKLREEAERQQRRLEEVYERLDREIMLATIEKLGIGWLPEPNVPKEQTPFNLQKSEKLVWVFTNVEYLKEVVVRRRTVDEWGVWPTRYGMTSVDLGMTGITTKHIYFAGKKERFRIRYDRIVTFKEYEDGFGLNRGAEKARHQRFVTGDGWFSFGLVTTLSRMY